MDSSDVTEKVYKLSYGGLCINGLLLWYWRWKADDQGWWETWNYAFLGVASLLMLTLMVASFFYHRDPGNRTGDNEFTRRVTPHPSNRDHAVTETLTSGGQIRQVDSHTTETSTARITTTTTTHRAAGDDEQRAARAERGGWTSGLSSRLCANTGAVVFGLLVGALTIYYAFPPGPFGCTSYKNSQSACWEYSDKNAEGDTCAACVDTTSSSVTQNLCFAASAVPSTCNVVARPTSSSSSSSSSGAVTTTTCAAAGSSVCKVLGKPCYDSSMLSFFYPTLCLNGATSATGWCCGTRSSYNSCTSATNCGTTQCLDWSDPLYSTKCTANTQQSGLVCCATV